MVLVGCGIAPQTTKIKLEILKSDKDTPLSLKISNHPNSSFNGIYVSQKTKLNNYPWYKKGDNRFLYYYNQAEGGQKGWSLAHRKPNGIKDWFSGGLTLPSKFEHPKPGVSNWGQVEEGLIQVVIDRNIKEVELFLSSGVDVNLKIKHGPKEGLTSLDAAIGTNQKEIADLLRKHGGKTGRELKSAELVSEAAETRDNEVIRQILASTEGKWILKAIGKEQGQEFNDAGTVINKWNESKSELLMESKINRGERIIELVDIIKIDKGRILMDRGSHQLIGKWNSNEKTIVWNNKSGDFVFTGSSDFSEKQNIKEAFYTYRDGTQVFSVTADLKAEAK